MNSLTPYLMALSSNFCFGLASMSFARFARSHKPTWINQLKVSVAVFGFVTAFLLTEHLVHQPLLGVSLLLTSGFIGLVVGDFFLFRAFSELGPSRTLVIFSFQPVMLGIYGYLALGQAANVYQVFAIVCMILCLLTFVREKNKETGHWSSMGFVDAFLGVLLDAIGVMCTRSAYELSPELGSFQANSIRAIGALIGFFIISPSSYRKLAHDLRMMPTQIRAEAIGACFLGTFISLSFYLYALKMAHVATVTAITITLPIWAALFEHVRDRKWPTPYLWFAFVWFFVGFAAMFKGMGF